MIISPLRMLPIIRRIFRHFIVRTKFDITRKKNNSNYKKSVITVDSRGIMTTRNTN